MKKSDLYSRIVDHLDNRGDVDPWVRDMLVGPAAVDAAWEARGNDWARDVKPQQWQQFFEHVAKARDALTRAWKLAPDLPEAPAAMISVAMGGGERLNEKVLDWFERALAAQVDFTPAYGRTLHALRPRWGGSYQEMLRVGLACLQRPRYDTLVPWQFVEAVRAIGMEEGEDAPWGLLRDPKVAAGVTRVVDGYIAAGGPRTTYYRSARAALARRAGDFAAARAKLPAGDPAARFVDVQARIPDADLKFAAGAWSPMLRSASVRREWHEVEGDWELDDQDRIRGRNDFSRKLLLWKSDELGLELGRAFEVAVNVEWVGPRRPGQRGGGGVVLFNPETGYRGWVELDLNGNRVYTTLADNPEAPPRGDRRRTFEVPTKDGSLILVRVVGEQVTVSVDGRQAGEPFPLPDRFKDGLAIGIGGTMGSDTRLVNPQVRRLPPPAPGPAGPAKP